MPFIHLGPYWWYAPGKVIFSLHFSTQLCLAGRSMKILDRSEMQVLTLMRRLCSISLTYARQNKSLVRGWNEGTLQYQQPPVGKGHRIQASRSCELFWPGFHHIANVYFDLLYAGLHLGVHLCCTNSIFPQQQHPVQRLFLHKGFFSWLKWGKNEFAYKRSVGKTGFPWLKILACFKQNVSCLVCLLYQHHTTHKVSCTAQMMQSHCKLAL